MRNLIIQNGYKKNLNGIWDFEFTAKSGSPRHCNRKILVPYPVESGISGIMEEFGAEKRICLRRNFAVDQPYENGRVLLHFGRVDWHSHVFINVDLVGDHKGGNEQEIIVTVWDPTDAGLQPVGKQTHDPRSIWYTTVSGIWQTLWTDTN